MNTNIEDLKHIRSMMERSSKFLSLSGLSGVFAGLFALIGTFLVYRILYHNFTFTHSLEYDVLIVAVLVVICAASTGLYFSMRKARKSNAKFWMPATRHILIDFAIPMVVGGIFCALLIYHHSSYLLASAMLIFYGLALLNAGSRTYKEIKILGTLEIILGIIAGLFTSYGLCIWGIGFGVLHILYGVIMWYRYEMHKPKPV